MSYYETKCKNTLSTWTICGWNVKRNETVIAVRVSTFLHDVDYGHYAIFSPSDIGREGKREREQKTKITTNLAFYYSYDYWIMILCTVKTN